MEKLKTATMQASAEAAQVIPPTEIAAVVPSGRPQEANVGPEELTARNRESLKAKTLALYDRVLTGTISSDERALRLSVLRQEAALLGITAGGLSTLTMQWIKEREEARRAEKALAFFRP